MTNDFLYRFVKSLDQGEIRFCMERLGQDERPLAKERMLLFKSLISMPTYSPKGERNVVKGTRMARHLAVGKVRLYENLLKHVADCHQSRQPNSIPQKRLGEGRVLLELGLFEDAKEVVLKGLARAVETEELLMEVSLRELLREILKNLPRGKPNDKLITSNEYELETAASKLQRLIAYTQINDRMYDYHRRFRVSDAEGVKNGIQELMNRPEMQSLGQADSLPSQIRFLYATSLAQLSEMNYEAALESKKSLVRLWESNPKRIEVLPTQYRSAISNLLGVMAMAGKLNEAPGYLKRLESITPKGRRDEVVQFCDVELQYFLYYMNVGQLEKALEREPIILNGIKRYGKQLSVHRRLTFIYNLGVTHLLCDNYGKALGLFDRIRQYGKLDARQDLQGVSRLLRLLLLCEKDAGTFMHYLRNSQTFFTVKDRHYRLENIVYRWLGNHYNLREKDERRVSFSLLVRQLEPLVKQKILGAEEMQLWGQANAQSTSVRKMFEQSLNSET